MKSMNFKVFGWFISALVLLIVGVSMFFQTVRHTGRLMYTGLSRSVVYPAPVNHSFKVSDTRIKSKVNDLANYRLSYSRPRTLRTNPFNIGITLLVRSYM